MLLASLVVAAAAFHVQPPLHRHAWPRCGARGRGCSMDAAAVDSAKAALRQQLLYNKPLTPDGEQLLSVLEGSSGEGAADLAVGKYVLNSSADLAAALRKAGGPLLDGAPVELVIKEDVRCSAPPKRARRATALCAH